jgi:CRP-like cAMP-binding protein
MAHPVQRHSSVRNGLLEALPSEAWARLEPHLEAVELPFDQTIHAAGGAVDAVVFVDTGMVSVIVTLEDGEQVETGIAGPEGLVGRIGAAAFHAAMDENAAVRGC